MILLELERLETRDCPSLIAAPPTLNGDVAVSNAMIQTAHHEIYLTDDGIPGHLSLVFGHWVSDHYRSVNGQFNPEAVTLDGETPVATGVDLYSAVLQYQAPPGQTVLGSNGEVNEAPGALVVVRYSTGNGAQWWTASTDDWGSSVTNPVPDHPVPTLAPAAVPTPSSAMPDVNLDAGTVILLQKRES